MNQEKGMQAPRVRRRRPRARTIQTVVAAVSVLALLAAVSATAAPSFPTHPFVPGSVVILDTTYPAAGNPAISLGQPLLAGGNAIADGKYPEVFNNDSVDGSFAVSTPLDLVDVDSSGNQLLQVEGSDRSGHDELLVEVGGCDQLLDRRSGSELPRVQRCPEHARRVELEHAVGARSDKPGYRRPVQSCRRRPWQRRQLVVHRLERVQRRQRPGGGAE